MTFTSFPKKRKKKQTNKFCKGQENIIPFHGKKGKEGGMKSV